MLENIEVFVERSFEAAHSLTLLPKGHKCHGVHGHHYVVRVFCSGPVDPMTGFVIDYGNIKVVLDPLIERVDHSFLNDELCMPQPSTELLARWLWDELVGALDDKLDRIEIRETNSNGCVYRRG